MLHAGFGRPAVRPAAVRCCALQRPSIDLAACPHWLGHCGCWRDRGGGTGAPLLHAGFGSCRGSGSATSALLSALPSALLLSAAAPCSVRVSVRDIHRSGLPARTGPAAQPSCRLHRQRTMPARAALLKSAGCLAKNDRHEPVSMAGRWAPPGAVQAAFAPPAAVCQGRPALWLGLVGAAMTAATSRWRGAALQCSTRACFGSGRGSGSATSDQCPACWSTIRGH